MDETDVKILRLLWEDGRMPIYRIAQRVGLSNAAVNKRIEAMKRRKELLGFSILLNPSRILNNAVISIRARKRRKDVWDAIEKVKGMMHFVACLGGRYYGELWYRDALELEEKLAFIEELTSAYKMDIYYHRKLGNVKLSKLDWEIIKALREDGRMSFSRLSEITGVSTKTISKRWKKMQEMNVCKVYPIVNRPMARDLFWFSLFMEVDDLSLKNRVKRMENLWRTSVFYEPRMVYGIFYARTVKQIDDTIERIWGFREVKKIYYEIIVEEKFYPDYINYVEYKWRS